MLAESSKCVYGKVDMQEVSSHSQSSMLLILDMKWGVHKLKLIRYVQARAKVSCRSMIITAVSIASAD